MADLKLGTTAGGYLVIHTNNFNTYSPTLTGTGASGTWGISVTGSAGSLTSSLVLKVNTGSTEGTNLYTFNGSGGKTLDFFSGTNVTLTPGVGTLTFSSPSLSLGSTVGTGNAVTDISLSGHQVTMTKGSTFLTSETQLSKVDGSGDYMIDVSVSGHAITEVKDTFRTAGSASAGALKYAGTTATAGQLDGGTTTPTGTTRLNYGGYFYPTMINVIGTADTATAASHYLVETGSDGFVRPKTLANVRTEVVTSGAVTSGLGYTAANDANVVHLAGSETLTGLKTFNAGLKLGSGQIIDHNTTSSRDKIRVWDSAIYTIGFKTGFTYGPIENDYAMSFQVNDTPGRGWWWGNSAQTDAQGSMALSNTGKLTVANCLRLGYGENDTVDPSSNVLDLKGDLKVGNGTNSVLMKYNATENSIDFIIN